MGAEIGQLRSLSWPSWPSWVMVRHLILILASCVCAAAFSPRLQQAPNVGRLGTAWSNQLSAERLVPLVSARPVCSRGADVLMAVPKKRQSKMKTRQRKANWFAKARRSAQVAMSRAKSAKYNPLEDPKYAFDAVDDEDDEDDDDE